MSTQTTSFKITDTQLVQEFKASSDSFFGFYKRTGNVVAFRLGFTGASRDNASSATVFTLPEELRPTNGYGKTLTTVGGVPYTFGVYQNGTVQITVPRAITNETFRIYETFII